VHVTSSKILTGLLSSFHRLDPIHQESNEGVFVVRRILRSGSGFHRSDRLFGSRSCVCLFGAVSRKMTCFVAVETSALLHMFLSFTIGHALTREIELGLSSVNVHWDVFIVGLLRCGVGGGGRSRRFCAAIVMCCASFLLGEDVSAFAPRLIEGGRLFSPFGKCFRLVGQLHPKDLGDKRAVHVTHHNSSKVSVVLDLLVP
jgi:hypothetical protein